MELSINTSFNHKHNNENYPFTLEVFAEHWGDFLNIFHVCEITNLEIRETLDFIEQYNGRVTKTGGVFFKKEKDVKDFLESLDK